eukprot:scaffold54313_cov63-Phaeocystis_antarctica.AAC.5
MKTECDAGGCALLDYRVEAALVYQLELIFLGNGELRHHRHRVLFELVLPREEGRHEQWQYVWVAHLHLVGGLDRQRR